MVKKIYFIIIMHHNRVTNTNLVVNEGSVIKETENLNIESVKYRG